MADFEPTHKAKRLRDRADEVRAIAEHLRHPETRNAMIQVAEAYERVATKLAVWPSPNIRIEQGG